MAGSDSGIFNWELLDEAATVTTLTLDQPEVDEKEKELGLAVETLLPSSSCCKSDSVFLKSAAKN